MMDDCRRIKSLLRFCEYVPKIVRIFRIYISFSVVYMETGKYDDRLDKYVIQKKLQIFLNMFLC